MHDSTVECIAMCKTNSQYLPQVLRLDMYEKIAADRGVKVVMLDVDQKERKMRKRLIPPPDEDTLRAFDGEQKAVALANAAKKASAASSSSSSSSTSSSSSFAPVSLKPSKMTNFFVFKPNPKQKDKDGDENML